MSTALETAESKTENFDPADWLDPQAPIDADTAARLAAHFEPLEPQDLLAWALDRWGSDLTLVTSFQAEDMALLDIAWRIAKEKKSESGQGLRIATLDTGRLHQETYDIMERVRERYGVAIEVLYPNTRAVEQLVSEHGPNLFHVSVENRLACCRVRKVEPLGRILADAPAWITGLRRDQAPSRAGTPKISLDLDNDAIKLAPIVDWNWDRLQAYLAEHDVPQHSLYSKGFLSIGCAPCTRPVEAGEDPRAGRWWWEQGVKECGLHIAK